MGETRLMGIFLITFLISMIALFMEILSLH